MDDTIFVYKPNNHFGWSSSARVPSVVLNVEGLSHHTTKVHVAPEKYFVARFDHVVM